MLLYIDPSSVSFTFTPSFLVIGIVIIILYIIICYIPARIAEKKGYSFAGFLCFALFIAFFPALVVALCLDDRKKKDSNKSAEALIKYKQLYDQGVITEEEFNRKKQELL